MNQELKDKLIAWEEQYNDPRYFQEDPIAFPREFVNRGASLQDVEIASVFAAHFAWGRRAMIVRDCQRLFDFMEWKPADYVMSGSWRDDDQSIHRTIKWSDTASICRRLREWYKWHDSLSILTPSEMRTTVFNQKEDPKAANKKINMMRRWLARKDGKVDLGLWTGVPESSLIIPLDVHVYDQAAALGLSSRKQKDITTAIQITDAFREIWPDDPVRGDFALFGYGVNNA